MKNNYFHKLSRVLSKIECRNIAGKALAFTHALEEISSIIERRNLKGNKVFLIGNGGSASIASHISIDLLKNAHVRSYVFHDTSLLTCISNDLGFEHVFEEPLGLLAEAGDILFSISSSGKSKNILNATMKARQRGCFIVTFSGFSPKNPLKKLGDINFYVPSPSYGFVEIAHLAICHGIVDKLIQKDGR